MLVLYPLLDLKLPTDFLKFHAMILHEKNLVVNRPQYLNFIKINCSHLIFDIDI
jgi:hypothetical protein